MTVTSLFDQLIDQFKLEKHIGQKTYTDIYLAYDVDEKRSAHVEILQPRYVEDTRFADAFAKRATALSRVRHPNLVRVFQSGTAVTNRPYVATEAIEGYPLSDRLAQLARQKSPVHSIYALKLVRQIAEAVQFAERLDLYHYALTPDNVLLKSMTLRSDDTVLLDNLSIPPQDGYVDADSRPYLSPEQLDGKTITGRSAIYSLGAMLHHLLSGAPPSGPVGFMEQTSSTLTGKSRLQSIRDDLTPELYQLVDRSLRSNPATRHRTVAEFITAVDEAIDAEELRIHSDEIAAPARRPWLLFGVLLALLLCLGMLWAGFQFLPGSGGDTPVAAGGSTAAAGMITDSTPTPSPQPTAVNTNTAPPSTPTSDTAAGVASETDPSPSATATHTAEPTSTPTPSPTVEPSAEPSATPSAEPSATAVPEFRISVSSAALRAGPGTIYQTLGYLLEGDTVTIIGRSDGNALWYNVVTNNNLAGWVSETVGERSDTAVDIPIAATIPVPPTLTPTATPTAIPSPTLPPPPSGGGGDNGGSDGGGQPPSRPTPTPPI